MQSNSTTHHCGQPAQDLVASILPPVLIIELLIGLPGNLMALWVFCRHLQYWSPNIVFLLNLVLADFSLLLSLPFRIDYFLRVENWVFGDVWCRIHLFMLAVNRSASIGFMSTVAVDRYFKIVHPHHKLNYISSWQAGGIACLIWVVVISLRLPLLTNNLLTEENNVTLCRSVSSYKQPPPGLLLHFIVFIGEFFLPLVLLAFCSVRIAYIICHCHMDKKKARRAIRTVLIIDGVFITCFLPGVATGLTGLYLKKLGTEYCKAYILTTQLFGLSIGFTYLNSAMDPLIYCFSSSMFGNEVNRAIRKLGQLSHHSTIIYKSNRSTHHCGQPPQDLVASILPPVLIIELLLGLPGNLMALWIFCCHPRKWKPNIVFLLNLVLADFTLLLSLPFRIDYLLQKENWVFGNAWCRINLFMLAVNRSASIGLMTAVAVDRYFKIVHPHHRVNYISVRKTSGIACFIWIAVISLRLPLLTNDLLTKEDNVSLCRSFNSYKEPSLGIQLHYMVYIGEFFLPLVLIVFCSVRITCILYHSQIDRRKAKRAIRSVLVIIGVFITCFLPGIATGLSVLHLQKLGTEYCKAYILTSQLFSLSIGFTYLNSVLDPLIYCFSSSMFSNELKRVLNRFGVFWKMTSNDTHCGLEPQQHAATILPPVLIVELLLGLPGNLLALWVFCRQLESWRPNIVFLLNLVLADFLLLVSLPFRIDYYLRNENWVFSDAWCRINLFMLAVNRSASIGFMTTVAVDRYFKIVYPYHKVNNMTSRQAAVIACFIWAVVISLRVPLLASNLLMEDKNVFYCRSFNPFKNPPPGIMVHYVVYLSEFFFCLMALVFCSLRICCILRRHQMEKKKNMRQAVRIVQVINAVFVICFCPGVIAGLVGLYLKTLGEEHCALFKGTGQFFVTSLGFTYLNSVLDPVIYGFCSSMFRDTVKTMINRSGLMELKLSHSGNTQNGGNNVDRTRSRRHLRVTVGPACLCMMSNDTDIHCGLSPQCLVVSVLPPVLIIELLLGLPCNLISLWVFCRHLHSWNPNVVYLFNLALADSLLLVSLPFRMDYYLRTENWVFGNAWCRINLFMLAVNRSASIAFMTTVAVNRYFKVVHPHHTVNFTSSRQAAGIACFIWAVVITLRLPLLTYELLIKKTNASFCRSFNPYKDPPQGIKLHYIAYLSEFFFPLMVLLFCSLRICWILHRSQIQNRKQMRRAIRIIVVIVGVFIICFCPGVVTGLSALYFKTLGEEHCKVFKLIGQLFVLSLGFTYLNSVLDPVIYGFCSSMFRDALKRSFTEPGALKLALRRCTTKSNGRNLKRNQTQGWNPTSSGRTRMKRKTELTGGGDWSVVSVEVVAMSGDELEKQGRRPTVELMLRSLVSLPPRAQRQPQNITAPEEICMGEWAKMPATLQLYDGRADYSRTERRSSLKMCSRSRVDFDMWEVSTVVEERYSSGEKAASMTCCAGFDGPQSSTRGECLEEEVSRIHDSCRNTTTITFADHPIVMGLITGRDKTAYRMVVANLVAWCQVNSVSQTKGDDC
ncbi:hypothetical protein NFI96_022032 [Prochilodus magdalenae]|nr:hypothetical protein NFI96_022032 [Prochilodus magdalenae]